MAYLGNDLQVAYQSYQIIDDISGSFNGVLTTFPLQVGGVTPVPFPINPQQCLISVNGVIQEPDPSGTSGFNLVGSNIEFSSAPTGGHPFFGVILAGADYVNVGVNYPSGSESAPSITFDTDLDTGIYNPADNELGLVTNSNDAIRINSSGDLTLFADLIMSSGEIVAASGSAATPSITFSGDLNTGIYSPGAGQVAISTSGTGQLFVSDDGKIGIGTATPSDYNIVADDLVIAPSTNTAGISLVASTANFIYFSDLDAEGRGTIGYYHSDDSLRLGAAANEHLIITSDGSVNIVGAGTASATQAVSFNGSAPVNSLVLDSSGRLLVGTSTSSGALLELGTAAPILRFSDTDTSGYHQIQSSNANFIINADPSNADANSSISFNIDGSEKASIDSSGRLLVGTPSTSADTLQIIQGRSGASAGNGVLLIARGSTPNTDGNPIGTINFSDNGHTDAATIEAARDGGTWTTGVSQPTALKFFTTEDGASSPTERVTINRNGTTTFNATIAPGDNYKTIDGQRAILNSSRSTTVGVDHILFINPNGTVGVIDTVGTSTRYITSSDYRLKENIVPVADGITRLQQLKPSRFNFITDPDTVLDGFLAHEVQSVVPEAITGEKDAVDEDGNPIYQGIDQSKMVPLLTAALQEVIGEIESLKARVAALEAS